MLEHLCQIKEKCITVYQLQKCKHVTGIVPYSTFTHCHVGSESHIEDITHEYDIFMHEYNTEASDEQSIIHEYVSGNDYHESSEQAIPPVAKGEVRM